MLKILLLTSFATSVIQRKRAISEVLSIYLATCVYRYIHVCHYFWPDQDTTPKTIGAAVGCREIRKPHPFRGLDVDVRPFLFMKLPINAR